MGDEEQGLDGTGNGSYNPQTNSNDQIGLVNANAQLNVSVFDSGAGASGLSVLGATAGTAGASATGIAAAIPVVGQVVAVAAAVIGIVQIFDSSQKQSNMLSAIKSKNETKAILQKELAVIGLEYSYKLQILKEEIAYKEQALQTSKILTLGSIALLGVSSMIFAYKIFKLKRS